MNFFVFTIFPNIIECYCQYGIVHQAIKKGLVYVEAVDLRKYADKGKVDDEAYGGFPGMVLKPEPIFRAYREVKEKHPDLYFVSLQPWGRVLKQEVFYELLKRRTIGILCGRYEGVDERVNVLVDEEISLGDYVLAGGELGALILIEGITRLIPGVLSEPKSLEEDSFRRWLGYPVYTRPAEVEGLKVPEVLLSGNHKVLELWKLWHSIERTYRKRPDLIPKDLTPLEESMLKAIESGLSFEEWLKAYNF
ncbi:tRNA (guanosine(37)-N1)-methyltransferase TrmD [Thermocrinis minervae]|uniref:tRNA (guanine-N(1)-)-methyltransferase n=1 Tax=Thermocrinis minervae TaxID=381751 RepID=A0A1M6QPE3_9AQUI|nr:tRNA (guanosine(37)-N1)-methyltransferase TrmD [Thermocrinis minervae]SHK22159.1 tRNA (guanine37-N1)-methyltransferase [Thermocrinis minervae]